jgi:hypothetical protein
MRTGGLRLIWSNPTAQAGKLAPRRKAAVAAEKHTEKTERTEKKEERGTQCVATRCGRSVQSVVRKRERERERERERHSAKRESSKEERTAERQREQQRKKKERAAAATTTRESVHARARARYSPANHEEKEGQAGGEEKRHRS